MVSVSPLLNAAANAIQVKYPHALQFVLGSREYLQGHFEQALPFFEKGKRLSLDNPGWPLLFGQVQASLGEIEPVVAMIDEKALAPDKHPLARLGHIFKFALLGDAASRAVLALPISDC